MTRKIAQQIIAIDNAINLLLIYGAESDQIDVLKELKLSIYKNSSLVKDESQNIRSSKKRKGAKKTSRKVQRQHAGELP